MTDFNAELKNPEGTEVLQAALVHPTDAATAQPAILNQVSPKGTITAGALPTVQLVSGAGAQVSTTRDVDTYTLWTGDATNNIASAAVAISPDNSTYTTIYTASLAAAVNNTGAIAIPLYARVPAGWYLKVTSVHGAALPTTAYYQAVSFHELPDEWPRNGTSSALQAAHIGRAGAGRVFGFTVYNSNAADQFVLVFDRNSIPSNGAAPDLIFAAGAKDNLLVNWIPGRWFRSGCVLCNSSTDSTLTAGSADCLFDVQYAQMPLGSTGKRFNGGTITQPLVLTSAHSTSDTADLLKANASNLANIFALFTSGDGQHTLAEDGANFIYTSNGADNPGEIMRIREYDVRFRNATDTANLLFVDRAGNAIGFFNHAPAAQPTGVAVTAAGIHAALVSLGLITA